MSISIETFDCLSDNYGFVVHDHKTGATAAIDAPEAGPIRQALKRRNWILSDIFITHHHWDHTGAIASLKAEFGVLVTGPAAEQSLIEGLDRLVRPGEQVRLGALRLEVLGLPGHTLGHIAFFDAENKNLFCGDALFSLGCGRMFEGSPGPMWAGLAALRDLPEETMVYCGHEYSAANAKFALSIDPGNKALGKRAVEIFALRAQNAPTVPFNLGEDKCANPFLRADDPELAARMGMGASDPSLVFAAIRKAKDGF